MGGGGLKSLLQERLTSLAASTQIFANCPAGCRKIVMTVQTQNVRLRFEAGTPTATRGEQYATGTYEFDMAQCEAKKVRAIEEAASASLDIEYFGRE
jgi:hypothetical protein